LFDTRVNPAISALVTTSPVVSSTLRDILGKSRAVYPQQGWGTYLNERMTSLADLTLWLLTTLVEAFVVYLFLIQRLFRRFLLLNFYLLLSITVGIGRYFILSYFGLRSATYYHFYFYTDALLMVFLFVSICELAVRLGGCKMPGKNIALWSAGALMATASLSFCAALPSGSRTAAVLLFELSQNVLFACCLAIGLLWAWRMRNDPEDRLAARFISVLTVYFLLFLLAYGTRRLVPQNSGLNSLYPMIGAWLPLGCAFALVSPEPSPRTKR